MIQAAGETLFARVRNLERELGVPRLHLKFEGSNPTGTQKDRIAQAHYLDAHAKGYDVMTVATCGNFGAALAYACSANGVRPVVFVPEAYHTRRVAEMERCGARIVRVAGDYETAVAASRAAAAANGWYDTNPGEGNWDIARVGYGRIAREIVEGLGRAPDSVAVSVGNGTTLAGIHDGFVEMRKRGDIDRVPAMVAASTQRGNPVVKAFKHNLPRCVDLDPTAIHETAVNEPLVNWHAFDGDRALEAVRATRGYAAAASDAEMRRLTSLVHDVEGIDVLTASSAALAGLAKAARAGVLPEDGLHVAVLTGRAAPRARPAAVAAPRAASAVAASALSASVRSVASGPVVSATPRPRGRSAAEAAR